MSGNALKILTFSSLYPNNVHPGHGIFVERRLLELQKSLSHAATVMAPVPWFPVTAPVFGKYAGFARVAVRETRSGVPVLHPRYPLLPKVGMNAAPGMMAWGCTSAVRRIHEETGGLSLIDAHYFYPDGVVAARIARKLSVPLIITARGSDINLIAQFPGPRKRIVEAAGIAAKVIAVSEALAERMAGIGIHPDKITVLRNGVDLDFFCPGNQVEEKRTLGVEGPLLLSAGSLIATKGHDIAIRLLEKEPDLSLVIAGHGPDEHKLRELARQLGVCERVRITGQLGPEELRSCYRAADALVLMSVREGMPNVVLESLACGTPVLASGVGGVPELIRDEIAGRVLSARDLESLARAWRELSRNLPTTGAVRDFARQFSWEPTIRGLSRIVAEAAA